MHSLSFSPSDADIQEIMESLQKPSSSTSSSSSALFQVYLRLRPHLTPHSRAAQNPPSERYLTVEPSSLTSNDAEGSVPTHITIVPPSDSRRRAVEKFAFTRVFEEDAAQLDIFTGIGVVPLIEGVLGAKGEGRDGLVATLGVTGSGKVYAFIYSFIAHSFETI